jgi:hypothetical protein
MMGSRGFPRKPRRTCDESRGRCVIRA